MKSVTITSIHLSARSNLNVVLKILATGAFLIIMAATSCKPKVEDSYLLAFSEEGTEGPLWGYKNAEGEIVIPPRYTYTTSDTLFEMAFVTEADGWIAIDRTGKKILTPFVYDNGVDYVKEDLFRIVENEKMGFADLKGNIVIPAEYDFVSPFNDGLAAFNTGGKTVNIDGEHDALQDGLWGYIDKSGAIVIEAQYSWAGDFLDQNAEVWTTDGKHLLIDKTGKILEELPDEE